MTTSKLMGHSSTSITERYLHISDDRRRLAVNELPKIEGLE
jgi:integrase